MSKQMWIGEKEATTAAEKGEKAALDCSIEHWRQLSHRLKSVLKALQDDKTCLGTASCALCQYWPKCTECPAYTPSNACCQGLHGKCHRPISQEAVPAFTRRANDLYKFLKGLKK